MAEELKAFDAPERIWLIHDPEADEPVTWADKPNPYEEYGEAPAAAVEYVRNTRSTPPLHMEEAGRAAYREGYRNGFVDATVTDETGFPNEEMTLKRVSEANPFEGWDAYADTFRAAVSAIPQDKEAVERVAESVKSYLMTATGFSSEYDDEGTVAAFYGGNWVTLNTYGIARAALSATPCGEQVERLREALTEARDRLIGQRDEPWPSGTDADRLHYWRDKAIEVARKIDAALTTPSQLIEGEGE